MPDDNDRPRDASSAADPGRPEAAHQGTDWADVSAPDDISELARDIKAYRRELRVARRQAFTRRVLARSSAAPATMILVALTIAAVIAVIVGAMDTRSATRQPTLTPLARPTTAVGAIGGLLPTATLHPATTRTAALAIQTSSLRPAVIALLPAHCGCTPLLNDLAADTARAGSSLTIVAAVGQENAEALSLAGQLTRGPAAVFTDANGTVATALGAKGLTLAEINDNGTIRSIQPSVKVDPGAKLTTAVRALLGSKAATG